HAARADESIVRIHAMRILEDIGAWKKAEQELALTELRDRDPYVERAAAEAIGVHADVDCVAALLELRRRIDPQDAQLLHVTRIALRNQLSVPGRLRSLAEKNVPEADS